MMTNDNTPENVVETKRYVIVDTNVFQHYATEELATKIAANLREAIEAQYDLALSDYSFFESLDEATPEKEKERLTAIGLMNRFSVDQEVLIAAAHLGSLYKEDGHQVKDDGDKIIGATAILTNSLIYTINGRDFPRPFFIEVASRLLTYGEAQNQKCMLAHFLMPNYDFIGQRFSGRMNGH